MIRLGVIGCGTASLISIISVLSHCKLNNWLERIKIECIYDPNIPMLTVGEGISPSFHHVLKSTLGFNMDDLAKVDGTIRWGGRHFWEENLGKEFNVMYGSEGIHINSEKFSKYLLTKVNEIFPDNFTEYHDNVTNVVHEDDKVGAGGGEGTRHARVGEEPGLSEVQLRVVPTPDVVQMVQRALDGQRHGLCAGHTAGVHQPPVAVAEAGHERQHQRAVAGDGRHQRASHQVAKPRCRAMLRSQVRHPRREVEQSNASLRVGL